MTKKILVLGVGQSNFLAFLYSALKTYDPSVFISAPFVKDLKNVKNESWMYNNELIKAKPGLLSQLQTFFLLLFTANFYKTFCFIFFVEGKPLKAFHFIYKEIGAKAFFIANKNFNDYDSFHFHYMQYSYVREVFFVPKNKAVVCHFWGSDLLRTSDILNFYIVKKALSRANVITCQSLELKEVILSKFGRDLEDKIKILIFGVDREIYAGIDTNRNNSTIVAAFKAKYGYSNEKINILVGHNGSVFNNHQKIISAIAKIQNKEQVHIIVNLNYAIHKNELEQYKKNLLDTLEQTNCTYTFLEHYFTREELPVSRLATDMFIHMPVSDALSGTMLEMMYAGTVAITGSWLPYKTFSNAGLHYHEVSGFEKLAGKLDAVVSDFESEKQKATANRKAIAETFLSDEVIKGWTSFLLSSDV